MKTLLTLLLLIAPGLAHAQYNGDWISFRFRVGVPGEQLLFAVEMPIEKLRTLRLDDKVQFRDRMTGEMRTGRFDGPDFEKDRPRAVIVADPRPGEVTGPGRGATPDVAPSTKGSGAGGLGGLGSGLKDAGQEVLAAGIAGWAFEQLSHLGQERLHDVRTKIHGEQQRYEKGLQSLQQVQKSIFDLVVDASAGSGITPSIGRTDIRITSRDGYRVQSQDPRLLRSLVKTRDALTGFQPISTEQARIARFALKTSEVVDSYFFKSGIPVTEETVQFVAALGDVVIGLHPATSFLRSFHDLVTGRDFSTGQQLTDLQKGLAVFDLATLGMGSKVTGAGRAAIHLYQAGRDFAGAWAASERGVEVAKDAFAGRGPVLDFALDRAGKLNPVDPSFGRALKEIKEFRDYYRNPRVPQTLPADSGVGRIVRGYHGKTRQGLNDSPAAQLRERRLARDADPSNIRALVERWHDRAESALRAPGLSPTEIEELNWILRDTRGALSNDAMGDLP